MVIGTIKQVFDSVNVGNASVCSFSKMIKLNKGARRRDG